MAWKTLTNTDVYRRLTEPEITAIQTLATMPGQADPIPGEIKSCSNLARGYLPKYVRREAGWAIPDEMEDAVLSLVVYRLASRLPAKVLLTDARKDDRADANQFLQACQRGDIAVSITSNPSDTPLQQPIPRFSANGRVRVMRQQEGAIFDGDGTVQPQVVQNVETNVISGTDAAPTAPPANPLLPAVYFSPFGTLYTWNPSTQTWVSSVS